MMGIEDPSVLDEFVDAQNKSAIPGKVRNDRTVYFSQYDLGPLKSFRMLPKLGDFGLSERPRGPELLRHPIQPSLFQAPEVILGTGWSYSADIWNLGVLVSVDIPFLLSNINVMCRFGTFSRTGICFGISAPKGPTML